MNNRDKKGMAGDAGFFQKVATDLIKKKTLAPAVEALNQILASDPENTSALFKRARLYQEQKYHEQAIAEFKKLSFANTENFIGELSRYHCAQSYIELGQYGLAKLQLEFSLRRSDTAQINWLKIKSLFSEIDKYFNAEYKQLKLNAKAYRDVVQSTIEKKQVDQTPSFKR